MKALRQWNQDCFEQGKRLGKLFLLVLTRESYLLLANLLGLLLHPFATLAKLHRTRDKSQAILILGIPVGGWMGLGLLVFIVNFLLPWFGFSWIGYWKTKINIFLFVYFLVLAVGSFYLAYWIVFYIWVKRKNG